MLRINGIGFIHLGAQHQSDRIVLATLWFSFLFLPVIPVRREQLEVLPSTGSGYAFRVLAKLPLDAAAIIKTLTLYWVVLPLAVGLPVPLLVSEVWRDRLGWSASSQIVAIGLWALLLGLWTLGVAEVHERSLRPRTS